MAGGAELLLINAAIGGATSAVAGGDPLKGALLGAVGGGITGGISNALNAGTTALTAAPSAAAGAQGLTSLGGQTFAGASQAANAASTAAMAQAPQLAIDAAVKQALPLSGDLGAQLGASGVAQNAAIAGPSVTGMQAAGFAPTAAAAPLSYTPPSAGVAAAPAADKGMFGGLKDWWGSLSDKQKLLYGGGAGIGALMLSERMGAGEPPSGEYKGPLRKYKFDPFGYSRSVYAEGGITSLANGGYDRTVGEMPQYQAMASGGISDLGSYSDGGRMLRGPGDGMSDNIPGVIGGRRPARLADGEFVVPADVVSHLGNGSTDAGAKQLYAMMDRVRKQRTGTKKQGRQINPMRAMPA